MNINVDLNLPPEVEERLRATTPDLPSAVREAYAVDFFRQGVLTHYELG
jgi:hypothetical protein